MVGSSNRHPNFEVIPRRFRSQRDKPEEDPVLNIVRKVSEPDTSALEKSFKHETTGEDDLEYEATGEDLRFVAWPKISKNRIKYKYKSPSSNCSCCNGWLDEEPQEKQTPLSGKHRREREETIEHVLEVHAGKAIWKPAEFVINSDEIFQLVDDASRDYPDISDVMTTYKASFIPFLHRLARIRSYYYMEEQPVTKANDVTISNGS